jgi:hypothetical protein
MAEDQMILRTPSGDIPLGSAEEVRGAMADISRLTGGSSGGGRWSYVFAAAGNESRMISGEELKRLPEEAADLRAAHGDELSERARAFLDRLATLRQTDGSNPPNL